MTILIPFCITKPEKWDKDWLMIQIPFNGNLMGWIGLVAFQRKWRRPNSSGLRRMSKLFGWTKISIDQSVIVNSGINDGGIRPVK